MNKVLFIIIIITLFYNNVKSNNIFDAEWMKYIDDSLKINQINIPGTHDSGCYDTVWTVAQCSDTQSLTIKEQLEHGIRYLDIRLALDDDNNLYTSHKNYACYDGSEKLYLSKVLND